LKETVFGERIAGVRRERSDESLQRRDRQSHRGERRTGQETRQDDDRAGLGRGKAKELGLIK